MNSPPPTGKISPAQEVAIQRALDQRTRECPAPTPPPLSDEELALIGRGALHVAGIVCEMHPCPACANGGRALVAGLARLGFTIMRKP